MPRLAATAAAIVLLGSADRVSKGGALAGDERAPDFELVQPELFSANGGMPNAWADFDNDGDLDEFVGFRGRPNRLYRQDGGMFTDVAAAVGLADTIETRAAAWGDYDADGHVDLYVGFIDGTPNRLYRNDGNGRHFTDDAVVAWCKPIAGGDARYHVGLRFVWTAAATPNTLRMMAHQLVAGVNKSGAEQAPGGR